jgi:parallel beta-helix repeat protein
MRDFLIAVLSFLNIIASATDYYVSSSGSDKNAGATASSSWQSISRVNSVFPNLKPGDRILFRRDDSFTGALKVSAAGSPGSPITIGAFGKGKNPVISGFIKISGWKNEGNGIYSKVISPESAPSLITIDDKQYGMGRFPNNSYLMYESHKANSSITDDQLTDNPDWTGAEVVINKQNWVLRKYLITRHTAITIEYNGDSSEDKPEDDRGYFIQNDLRTLDTFGEWYFNKQESKFYMFFGNIDPGKKTVRIASVNHLFYNYVHKCITLDGLSFEGSIQDAVNYEWADDGIVRNCTVKFSGQSGLDIKGKNNKIDANDISWCNMAGIYTEGANTIITQNSVQNIGLIPGSTLTGQISAGIFAGGENSIIKYNSVINVGGMGIRAGSGWITTIKNNFINNFLLELNDGGGIYIDGNLDKTRIVEGNLILNGKGNKVGENPAACGIYLDEFSSNVLVKDNTVAFNPYGINLHKANSNTIINNLSFGNKVQIALHNTDFLPTIYRNKINYNIFFATANSSLMMFFNSKTDDIPHFGEADNNYYVWMAENDKVFYTFSPFTWKKYRSLTGWQSFTHQDANSHKSILSVNDTSSIDFYYNASQTSRIVSLAKKMIDVKGKVYSGNVILEPYTSIVLMADPIYK